MQVVIDIPEENYQNLKAKDKFDDMFLNYYEKLIVRGTPLPKGHGRLGDLDAALKCVKECEDCEDKTFAIALFDWAMSKRVVLEADKEVSE